MFVLKRDGRKQEVHFDKITARINKLSYNLNPEFCDPVSGPLLSSPHSDPELHACLVHSTRGDADLTHQQSCLNC